MPALGSAAGYTRTTYELAIAHAKKYPLVSVGGLSKRIGIATPQAEAIIKQMSSEGMLGVLNPTRPGTVKATSKICTKDVWGLRRTSEPRAVQADKPKARDSKATTEPNISAMFALAGCTHETARIFASLGRGCHGSVHSCASPRAYGNCGSGAI